MDEVDELLEGLRARRRGRGPGWRCSRSCRRAGGRARRRGTRARRRPRRTGRPPCRRRGRRARAAGRRPRPRSFSGSSRRRVSSPVRRRWSWRPAWSRSASSIGGATRGTWRVGGDSRQADERLDADAVQLLDVVAPDRGDERQVVVGLPARRGRRGCSRTASSGRTATGRCRAAPRGTCGAGAARCAGRRRSRPGGRSRRSWCRARRGAAPAAGPGSARPPASRRSAGARRPASPTARAWCPRPRSSRGRGRMARRRGSRSRPARASRRGRRWPGR